MRIKDSDTALTLAAGARTCPEGVPMRQRRDWWLPYERERARAEAAEACAQELRWAEVAARCDAGSWKSRFEASRRKLKAAVEQAKEARHHYLGDKTLAGARMRYTVHDRDGRPLSPCSAFSTAAWRLAPRDRFIGWTPQLREKNLPLVAGNPRFLILPWSTIPNLGSQLLAIFRRQLPVDWAGRYKTRPVLIETFVETPRHTGAVYRASGWTPVGTTQGRGRYDTQNLYDKPKKDIWLRPLRRDWKHTLNR